MSRIINAPHRNRIRVRHNRPTYILPRRQELTPWYLDYRVLFTARLCGWTLIVVCALIDLWGTLR